jgi:heme/copper-type cytochrome/quinol oxidase subunit 4
VDSLKAAERAAQTTVERLDADVLARQQQRERLSTREAALRETAQPAYERAQFATEMRVFGIRLALTLPLLLVAWWLVRRKRASAWWPLLRGVVLFALIAFFVELVPYLPSYGGYVRSIVGVVACIAIGRWGIGWMQHYVARREAAERQSEVIRREALRGDDAIKKMSLGMCPGCERPIATAASSGSTAPANFCVHCGLTLFNQCGSCGTRKNAFFTFCPSCGTGVAGKSGVGQAPAQ